MPIEETMGKFNASLRTLGERRGLPATVTIEDDHIAIAAGDQEIGQWALDEVRLEATAGSTYRMEAEGDHILIEFEDVSGFRETLDSRLRRRPKVRTARRSGRKPKSPVADVADVADTPTRPPAPKRRRSEPEKPATTVVADEKPAETAPPKEKSSRVLAMADRLLTRAERRWGSLLPSWVFTRATLLALVILLLTTVFLPGLVSTVVLVLGLVGVLFGAVAYTDMVVASKWLPGRMTPMHVLIGGVGLVILGVLLGMMA